MCALQNKFGWQALRYLHMILLIPLLPPAGTALKAFKVKLLWQSCLTFFTTHRIRQNFFSIILRGKGHDSGMKSLSHYKFKIQILRFLYDRSSRFQHDPSSSTPVVVAAKLFHKVVLGECCGSDSLWPDKKPGHFNIKTRLTGEGV